MIFQFSEIPAYILQKKIKKTTLSGFGKCRIGAYQGKDSFKISA